MSVSLTLQNSINFIRPYLKNQPVTVIVQEPGLQAANLVLQILTKAPLRWRWNRRTFTFQLMRNIIPGETREFATAVLVVVSVAVVLKDRELSIRSGIHPY